MEINAEAKKRLSALIEERDAPLAPLAAKIGVSQSTLWNFIYGGTKNFSKIHRLATELRVSLDWIVNGDQPRGRAGTERDGLRLSEPPSGGFKHNTADRDGDIVREIALVAARLARDYPKLDEEIICAIAVTIGADLKSGKLPVARGKNATKAIAAEAQKLAAYELRKLG